MASQAHHIPQISSTTLEGLADPKKGARFGSAVAAMFFVGFLGWATFARLDAAAYATGSLVVSGERQSVQHRDGGVVSRLYIKDGDRVRQGQLLVTLAAAEVSAQEEALASQSIRLLAQRARLEAEQVGRSEIQRPPEFDSLLRPEHREEAALSLQLQQAELKTRSAVLLAQRNILRERGAQSSEEGRGYVEQSASTREQLRLVNEQIAALQPLVEKGFVSKTRMRELERTRAALAGQQGQYVASIAQARGAVREEQVRILETENSFRERTTSDLHDVESRLGEILPKWRAARDQLMRTEIRAPATGEIVGLSVFTQGGVIAPGQKLMDIVPEQQPLRVQFRLSPDDADDLHVGQKLEVKLSGLHERTLPPLSGQLVRLSADSLFDERTGERYFSGVAEVPLDQLKRVQAVRGKDFALRAGMPAEVLISLRKRSALDYMLEPLIGSFWSSFREH